MNLDEEETRQTGHLKFNKIDSGHNVVVAKQTKRMEDRILEMTRNFDSTLEPTSSAAWQVPVGQQGPRMR